MDARHARIVALDIAGHLASHFDPYQPIVDDDGVECDDDAHQKIIDELGAIGGRLLDRRDALRETRAATRQGQT